MGALDPMPQTEMGSSGTLTPSGNPVNHMNRKYKGLLGQPSVIIAISSAALKDVFPTIRLSE